MTQNSNNQDFSNDSDGFTLGGGTTERKLSVTGGDVTITGSGTAEITFPATDDTLVGRDTTDTFTNKTIDGGSNTITGLDSSTLAESAVTNSKLDLSTTTDANGWTVLDLGGVTLATKRITFTGVTVSTSGTTMTISSSNLPVGLSTVGGSKSFIYSQSATGFASQLNISFEGSMTATSLNFTAVSNDSSRAYDGTIDCAFVF